MKKTPFEGINTVGNRIIYTALRDESVGDGDDVVSSRTECFRDPRIWKDMFSGYEGSYAEIQTDKRMKSR